MKTSDTVILEPVLPPFCNGSSGYYGCPQVFRTNRSSFVIQGYVLDAGIVGQMNLPGNEAAIEIPESMLFALIEKLQKPLS